MLRTAVDPIARFKTALWSVVSTRHAYLTPRFVV
ncbi:MAG: hypothetical protein QOJ81_128 [Chloroflexota bacterium]|jgi:hypothetical protein|nr:hypothetical protein [Chloroflexota bacterium]